ncbi:MAG: hypothetical protein JW750_02785, partial [Anaerolineaceae bacterium]|nr:hypothetical protein [Anaerolineaceae bacterium]
RAASMLDQQSLQSSPMIPNSYQTPVNGIFATVFVLDDEILYAISKKTAAGCCQAAGGITRACPSHPLSENSRAANRRSR